MLGYEGKEGTFTACAHAFDGAARGGCVEGLGWPARIVALSERFYAVAGASVAELDFDAQKVVPQSTAAVLSEVPVVVGAGADRIVRLDAISLRGQILDIGTGEERSISLISPTLAQQARNRGPYEILVQGLVGAER